MDNNIRFSLAMISGNQWLAIRLQTVGALMIWLTTTFAVMRNSKEKPTSICNHHGTSNYKCFNYYFFVDDVLTLGSMVENSLNSRALGGSVRFNLDPFQEHADFDLWEVLERTHLMDVIRRNTLGLDAESFLEDFLRLWFVL
ncbi:hypothetical protein IC575_030451 [Cucumis melo]